MKRGIFLAVFLLILFSYPISSKECDDALRPKLNISGVEELSENAYFFKTITNDHLKYFNYFEINSTFHNFYVDKKLYQINVTPTFDDLGRHYMLFIAIDSMNCYTSKLVEFQVYDRPKIFPLKPKEQNIEIIEGQSILFFVDVEDEDKDVKDFSWYVNGVKSEGKLREKFPFVTKLDSNGDYAIDLVVTDSKGFQDNYGWNVSVKKNNKAPQKMADLPEYATPGKITTASLKNYFNDPNSDALKFEVSGKDEKGNKIDLTSSINDNAELTIDAPSNYSGVIVVEVKASDSESAYSLSTFKIFKFNEESYMFVDKKICGDYVCSVNESCSICPNDCGPCSEGFDKCINRWQCSSWSECILPGYAVRTCVDLNSCIDKSRMPKTFEKCESGESCNDGLKNQRETGVDCGGPCNSCPTCFDGKQNQGEEGIDCGGPCQQMCPTCFDNTQNQMESDIDCGGPCDTCPNLDKCYSWKDCESRVCKSGVCQIPTCFDKMRNGKEEGADCGKVCGNICPTCFDGIRNQDEGGIDCGGICEPCESCFDKIKNQDEYYTDCGGKCRKCTYTDFRENNPKLIFVFKIIMLVMIIPVFLILFITSFKKYSGKRNVEFLILFNKILFRKKCFKGKKEAISKTIASLRKFQRDIVDAPRKEIKNDTYNVLSSFLQNLASIDLVNDDETNLEKLRVGNVGFPMNLLVMQIIFEAREIHTNKYISNIDLVVKIERLVKIIHEIESKSD